jgi:hypothetical protein
MSGKHRWGAAVVVAALAISGGSVWASSITMNSKTMTDLLGSGYHADGDLMKTVVDRNNLLATVYSQAFSDDTGSYVYLYEVVNTGAPGNAPVEMFTIWPFAGASDSTDMGYLAGAIPAGFLGSPWQIGQDKAYIKPLGLGPQISFYFTLLEDDAIDPGEHSQVIYVKSQNGPDEITGNVIDGTVTSGIVIGPAPEPVTLAMLAVGALAVLRRRKA